MEVAYFFLLLPWLAHALGGPKEIGLHITRQNTGDLFSPEDSGTECKTETCVGLSSGTAQAISGENLCNCQCHAHLPAFREDLRICVDDIHECMLAPFVGGSTSQQIPFVFLPLKGQIIHPSKEINFAGIQTPVCAVSGAKFLTEAGWVDLRNPIDTDVPFRLFRDEGRTFLQWVGEPELRNKMSGRLVLIYMMCRELATTESVTTSGHTLFSPCVAFRVVGNPSKYLNNVSEVAFSADTHSGTPDHLSVSEYVAIGICSVLLGLIYVASVFLYLHLRKRNREVPEIGEPNLAAAEEGVVKNNPLLAMAAHFQPSDAMYSDSGSSDTDVAPDIIQHHDDRRRNTQMTSALVHHQYKRDHSGLSSRSLELSHQDSASIEKLPEENVSIVETLECREERPDNLRALTGTVRRKLYFNPAYFEPQLLMAPPPAALEFLAKIREVITIAKQKMSNKRFAPSLMGIPEEENNYILDAVHDYARSSVSRRSSMISLKRENSRRKTCTGCPGCEPQDFKQLCGRLPEFPSLAACQNCSSSANDSKQRSIRKWLEDVPILKQTNKDGDSNGSPTTLHRAPKRVRSPAKSLPPETTISAPTRALSPKPASERAVSPKRDLYYDFRSLTRQKGGSKSKAPPPPIKQEEEQYDTISSIKREIVMNFPPPDMIHEAMVVDNRGEEIRIPTLTKKQMKAVIEELTEHQSAILDTIDPKTKQMIVDYETDSLERSGGGNKGYSTPSDYAELSSSQPSPSLSTALPMDEEMTMRNAIFNKNTGNMTISKINGNRPEEDDHDYELIVLKKGSLKKPRFYKLPELLQRSNGYSLVSEVYVNNGYNYGSAPSSPSESNCSTLEKRTLKVRYEEGVEKPGKLLIEVEDCPDNYIPIEDSDSFEPDTLDRKPSTVKINKPHLDGEFVDSLERPQQILLKSSGSFKKEMPNTETAEDTSGDFNRMFGSLREIYEAKTKASKQALSEEFDVEEGRLLTLEERHSRRQRQLNSLGGHVVPPDVIPPPPHNSSPIYERPKPPRKIILADDVLLKPPLPPKNGDGRSVSNQNTEDSDGDAIPGTPDGHQIRIDSTVIIKPAQKDQIVVRSSTTFPHIIEVFHGKRRTWKKLVDGRPEDSGYLSTDSSDSRPRTKAKEDGDKASESEESLEDGHSESGAESVETHSVFFGSFRKPTPYLTLGSMDSGVDADTPGVDGDAVHYANVNSLNG